MPSYIGTRPAANSAVILAMDATDVGIVGNGTIDGQGGVTPPGVGAKSWWDLARTATFPYPAVPFAPSSNGHAQMRGRQGCKSFSARPPW